jgi:flotillin
MDQAQLIGIYLGIGAFGILALVIFIKANIVICQPNEVVIISGRKRKTQDGTVVGYRLIRGGRGFKWPLLESAMRLPLTTRTVQVRPHKALCRGMIPVDIEGKANVKLAGREDEGLEAGIERFLGKGVEAIDKTAQQVLEGALRGVIAGVSPEEANERRLDLAQEVTARARGELSGLGIVLDFFQIQDLSDEAGYLEAIGRKRNAEVQRDARIAEAQADAEARQVSAEQKRLGREGAPGDREGERPGGGAGESPGRDEPGTGAGRGGGANCTRGPGSRAGNPAGGAQREASRGGHRHPRPSAVRGRPSRGGGSGRPNS